MKNLQIQVDAKISIVVPPSPQRDFHVLTTNQILQKWPDLEKGLWQMWLSKESQDEVILSVWVSFGSTLNPVTCVLVRHLQRRKTQSRSPCEEGVRGWNDAATSPEIPGAPRSWNGRGSFLSYSLQQRAALPTPWFRTSGLQNCARRHFCCFKAPSLQ